MKNIQLIIVLGILLFCGSSFGQTKANYFQHLRVKVTGQGQPVLFIPGYSCSMDVWKEVIPNFEQDYECHVFTLPGFAENDKVVEHDFLKTVQEELTVYIKEKNLKNPIVVGHSMGGFMGLYLAANNPDLLGGVLVVDGVPFITAYMNPAVTQDMAKQMAENTKKQIESASTEAFKQQQTINANYLMREKSRLDETVGWALQGNRKVLALAIYELMLTDIREDLSNISVPVKHLGAYSTAYTTKDLILGRIEGQYKHLKTKELY